MHVFEIVRLSTGIKIEKKIEMVIEKKFEMETFTDSELLRAKLHPAAASCEFLSEFLTCEEKYEICWITFLFAFFLSDYLTSVIV